MLGREICFIQSTDAGINLIKNTLIDTLRNNVCPGILTSHG